jgi:hypothetical protein
MKNGSAFSPRGLLRSASDPGGLKHMRVTKLLIAFSALYRSWESQHDRNDIIHVEFAPIRPIRREKKHHLSREACRTMRVPYL